MLFFSQDLHCKDVLLLTCTHLFHAKCLTSYERYTLHMGERAPPSKQQSSCCPLCRAAYQTRAYQLSADTGRRGSSDGANTVRMQMQTSQQCVEEPSELWTEEELLEGQLADLDLSYALTADERELQEAMRALEDSASEQEDSVEALLRKRKVGEHGINRRQLIKWLEQWCLALTR